MHQPMAEVMQVETFRGHVGAEQNANGVILAAEAIDQILLLGISHAAMQNLELGRLQTGSLGSCSCNQRRVSIRSENMTRRSDASAGCQLKLALEVLHQVLEFAETGGVDLAQGSCEPLQAQRPRPLRRH